MSLRVACRWCTIALALVAVALPAGASAASRSITGTLSKRGYVVIALAANGRAATTRATTGTFRLTPPAAVVTLHLRAPDGTYGGPVVIGSASGGKRAIVGVRAGARLGRIVIRVAKGYAKPVRRPARSSIDAARVARARGGVPIGAGNLGLVRSAVKKGGPGDRDLDGVPNALDVDVDGDGILDDYDRSPTSGLRASAAQVHGGPFPDGSRIQLGTGLAQPFQPPANWAVNVDGGSTAEDIATVQRANGQLHILWSGIDAGSGELDCGVLVYCRTGGTGRLVDPSDPSAAGRPYPDCCDADHDGLGSLTGVDAGGGSSIFRMSLAYGTTVDEIKTGDVLIERGTVDGSPQESAATLGFIFATHPVIAAYSDMQGDSGTFSYPPSEACREAPGACGAPVRAGADGDVVLQLSFWRPQRPRIEGEPGEGPWMDVGHLAYAVGVSKSTGGEGWCPRSAYTSTDPNLTALTTDAALPLVTDDAVWIDGANDQSSNAANTFTATLNLSRCYAALGLPPQVTPVKVYAAPIEGSTAHAFAISETQFRQLP